jgi:hypothetical protein
VRAKGNPAHGCIARRILMASTTFSPLATARTKKLNIYIMYEGNHPFIVGRRTEKNAKGKHVTREEFMKLGCLWPTRVAKTREEFATLLGETILDEVFAPATTTAPVGRTRPTHPTGRHVNGVAVDHEDEAQEMPWEHGARDALERFMATGQIDGETGTVEFHDDQDPHDRPITCKDLDDLRVLLHEIGGNGWSGSVPVESGIPVWDWSEVSDDYIDQALELRPDLVEFFDR